MINPLFVVIGLLVAPVILRAAITVHNHFVGGTSSPRSVPMPGYGHAFRITLAAIAVQAVIGFALHFAAPPVYAALDLGGQTTAWEAAQLAAFPIGLVILAGAIHKLLPTTARRAGLVVLCQLLVVTGIFITAWIVVTVGLQFVR